MSKLTTDEIIKKHIPEFHQWHEHCQKMVRNALTAQKLESASRANDLITESYSEDGKILTPKRVTDAITGK